MAAAVSGMCGVPSSPGLAQLAGRAKDSGPLLPLPLLLMMLAAEAHLSCLGGPAVAVADAPACERGAALCVCVLCCSLGGLRSDVGLDGNGDGEGTCVGGAVTAEGA